MGLDDVRPFNFRHKMRIPVYCAADTMSSLQRVFHYVFEPRAHSTFVPQIEMHLLDGVPVDLFGIDVQPIPLMHGKATIFGYRFGRAAYLTDHSEIPAESMEMLRGLDVLFLDALRHNPHPTHSTVETSIQTVRELAPGRAYFTHMSHDLAHAPTQAELPPGVYLAYDGLEIDVD
jgi:phosphoribosyl 1,2-cyclic phosphate phosphodiesterase